MASVLVVEDDAAIADLVALYLRHAGFDVQIVANGLTALEAVDSGRVAPDLIVLDLMLPGLDGRGVARRIRSSRSTPILMVTALDDDRDKIEGLELGADDYLTKPFNPLELVARVRAILRRAIPAPAAEAEAGLTAGNVGVSVAGRRVTVGGAELTLRAKEFDLLVDLMSHSGIVRTRDQLLDRVWGGEYDGDTRTVDVTVSRLRDRLGGAGASVEIETVRGVGCRLPIQERS